VLNRILLPFLTLALAAADPVPVPKKAAPTPEAPKEDPILARIGKQVIRQSDFDVFLDLAVPPQQRPLVNASPDMKEQYLRRFLDFNILAARAKMEKLDATPTFKQKRALREMETLVQDLMQRDADSLQKQVQPTDEILKAYFEAHKDTFKTPEKYTARHILIGTKDNPRANGQGLSDEEAKAKAAKVLAELKAGKKIEDLTATYSDDPGSKDKGGLYENIAYGQFVPEFDAAVKGLNPGQISDPVKTQFGYHIIQVEKKTPAETPGFDAVKEKVKQAWQPQRQEEVFKQYIEKAKVGLNYVEVAPVAKPAGAAAPKAPKGTAK